MADKLPSASFHFVLHEDGHRFSVSGEREASDIDYFPVLFVTFLDRILVNALYRDHGIAEISLEGRLRSVQPRSVPLPGWIGEAEGVASSFKVTASAFWDRFTRFEICMVWRMVGEWRVFRPSRRAPQFNSFL